MKTDRDRSRERQIKRKVSRKTEDKRQTIGNSKKPLEVCRKSERSHIYRLDKQREERRKSMIKND